MFSRAKSFISRHKRKFFVGGAIVVVGGLAYKHLKKKFEDYQEKQVRDFLEKTRRLQHFETIEKTHSQAIFGLLPGLCESIVSTLNSEDILAQLRQVQGSDKKLELWHELKVLAFTRCSVFVYSIPILVAAMKVQLNVIGGYMYKDTIASEEKITKEIQTMYNLIVIQQLTNVGLSKLIKIIRSNVGKVLEHVDLKQEMNLADIEQLFWSIQSSIDKQINRNYSQFVLPVESQFRSQYDSSILHRMLADTIDVYECGEFIDVIESTIGSGFHNVTEKISGYYTLKPETGAVIEEINSEDAIPNNIVAKKIAVAKLIPIINSLTTQTVSTAFSENSSPENLAAILASMFIVSTKLQNLGANVYEVYCQ